MNELLWFLMVPLNFGAILLLYKVLKKPGLFVWIPIASILANIQVLKTVEIFGLTATLGNIIYATSFLVTDILSENYGKKEARKGVFIGFFSIIVMTVLMNVALAFTPAAEDFAQESLATIFSFMWRIALASISAYLLSQLHDVWAYDFWKRKFPNWKFIAIRNNASTFVSQLIDSAVFTLIAFWGQFPVPVLLEILVTTYIFKVIVAALDTPLVYLARYWKSREKSEKSQVEVS